MVLFQADLLEWLCALGLPQYHKHLVSSGYDSMGLVAELTWEELQEIDHFSELFIPFFIVYHSSSSLFTLHCFIQATKSQPSSNLVLFFGVFAKILKPVTWEYAHILKISLI